MNAAKLKEVLGKHSDQFRNNAQQDAHEFYSECLNLIEEEVTVATQCAVLTTRVLQVKGAVAMSMDQESIRQGDLACPVESTFG